VHTALKRAGLLDAVDATVARGQWRVDPGKLKPSPDPIRRALNAVNMPPAHAVLIGDSTNDVHAGANAGVATIGVAADDSAAGALRDAGATLVVGSFAAACESLAPALVPTKLGAQPG
jgi:phosphoglycolate phosphatase-like HAD superfamily hydrolase